MGGLRSPENRGKISLGNVAASHTLVSNRYPGTLHVLAMECILFKLQQLLNRHALGRGVIATAKNRFH